MIELFSSNHAYHAVCAFIVHLAQKSKTPATRTEIIDHPAHVHVHVPAMGRRVSFGFKASKRCVAERKKVDAVVGLQQDAVFISSIAISGLKDDQIDDFVEAAEAYWHKLGDDGKSMIVHVCFYNDYYAEWKHQINMPLRDMDTVFMGGDTKARITESLKTFQKSEAEHVEAGIPYKYVALLHGPPGTGKTSLVLSSLAAAGIRNVYIMSFGATITDALFIDLIHTMKPRSALVMEDADTLVVNRKVNQGMSFSTMLNVLDGPLRPHGLVCFLTTNHIDRFDDAMLRTGRMNELFHIDQLDRETATEMVVWFLKKYYKSVPAAARGQLAADVVAVTRNPSAISSFLFANRHNPLYSTSKSAHAIVDGLKQFLAARPAPSQGKGRNSSRKTAS